MEVRRLLIVDDHPALRRSLVTFMRAAFPQACVQEAHNGREALDVIADLPPDAVIMDAVMPHVDGIEATRQIKAQWPEVRIVILGLYWDQREAALQAGADVWALKGHPSEYLVRAIQGLDPQSKAL